MLFHSRAGDPGLVREVQTHPYLDLKRPAQQEGSDALDDNGVEGEGREERKGAGGSEGDSREIEEVNTGDECGIVEV